MPVQPPNNKSQLSSQLAWRAGSEFLSGILVGVFFGYLIDRFFATKPWGMIVMILLGAAAGIRNIFRVVNLDKKTLDSSHSD